MSISREEITRPKSSTRGEMDKSLVELKAHKQQWVDLSIDERISIVEDMQRDFLKITERWSQLSVAAKGINERKFGNDMEWLELAVIARIHHVVHRSLCDIRDTGRPRLPGPVTRLENGRLSARVYPDYRLHGMLFRGITIDVWMQREIDRVRLDREQALAYRTAQRTGLVALVLGAGNASSLPPSDTLHKLFNELRVVALKMNPINSYLGPLLERAYRSLIERGFLRILYGGPAEGTYLVHHPLVEECHMTGSNRTFDAITFGQGEDGRRNKAERNVLVKKRFTGELGCITPWIVVPGPWRRKDVETAASRMAFWMVRHEGYLCFAPRVLILLRGWEYRRTFLDTLRRALEKVEPIRAYYPGSANLQKKFVKEHPEAIQIGGDEADHIPWTIIENVNPDATDDVCFNCESFSGLCAETSLTAETPTEYLRKVVNFLNENVWGNLSATLVVSKTVMKDPRISTAVENAIRDLRYGTIGVNCPGTWGFYTMIAPWGGYPGNTQFDIQSGTGHVANFLMLPQVEKTIVRAPLEINPYPFKVDAKRLESFSKKLAYFEAKPAFSKYLGLVWRALRT